MRGRLPLRLIALLGAGVASTHVAGAAEVTDVASAFDSDNAFDFRLRVGYDHWEKRASIKREQEGPGQDSVQLYKDLLYTQSRDTLSLRTEISIFQDLMIYGELPFVLGDNRSLSFDQSQGANCIYPGGSGTPNCVNASNSTTVQDGILPQNGFDAATGAALPPGDLIFRGPKRGGSGLDLFDTLNLGITWAPLSQKRDDTKPTWTVNLEGKISIGNIMMFDRMHPDANHGVSEGLHHLIARTSVSKRFRYFDPFVSFWYDQPFARDGSLFTDYGPTQKNKQPQPSAGTMFGLEGVPWERPESQYKIAIQVMGRVSAKFDGRGYSEMWEVLASSPAMFCDPMYNPSCDTSQNANNPHTAYQNKPFTGLTTIENYATLGADIALVVQAGRYARFWAGFNYWHDQSHFLTIDDVGVAYQPSDMNCSGAAFSGGRVSKACEFNPAYRPVVDQVGRRYKVDDVNNYNVGLWGQVMF